MTEWHQGWMGPLLHAMHFVSSVLQLSRPGRWDMGGKEPELWEPPEPAGTPDSGCRLRRGARPGALWPEPARRAPGWGADAISLPGVQAGLGTTAPPGHPCSPWLENCFQWGLRWAGLLRQLERTASPCPRSCVCSQAPAPGELIKDRLMIACGWAMSFQYRVFTRHPCPT